MPETTQADSSGEGTQSMKPLASVIPAIAPRPSLLLVKRAVEDEGCSISNDSVATETSPLPVSPPGQSTAEALLHHESLRGQLMSQQLSESIQESEAMGTTDVGDTSPTTASITPTQPTRAPAEASSNEPTVKGRTDVRVKNFFSLALKILCTFWVDFATIFFSAVGCCLLIGFRCFQLIRDFVVPAGDEAAKAERAFEDEQLRSLMVDASVRGVMLFSRIVCPVKVLGTAGRPHTRMGKEEWASWKAANLKPENVRNRVQWLPLPRDDHGDCKLPYGCLLMCNHMSNLDGFSTKSTLFPSCSKAIIKSDVRLLPIVGWLVWLSNEPVVHFVKVAGQWTTQKKEKTMQRCKEVVDAGYPLIIYPEGARRTMGRMAPFRHGMINFAIENQCPIYPAIIHGTQHVWPVHSAMISPGRIYMSFADEVIIPRPDNTPEEICEALKIRMLTLLSGVPGYDAEAERPFESYAEFKRAQADLRHLEESKKTK